MENKNPQGEEKGNVKRAKTRGDPVVNLYDESSERA